MPPPPRQQEQQHYLYLVLDNELEDDYSIHKIDVGDLDPDDTDDLDSRARPLPDPPLLRVDADRGSATCFVAHGTKILAMPPSPGRAALALDTVTMAITAGPLPKANDQRYCCGSFVAVGDRLYSMDERETDYGPCNFEALHFAGGSTSSSSRRYWSWSSVPSQPPFDPVFVCCYAVHPDGRTIFFSVECSDRIDPPFREGTGGNNQNAGATFSFDVEALTWTFRGYWTLPISGQAHYDVELDAWVGLHDGKGRVCCCDVLPPATGEEAVDRQPQAPPPKLATGRLFRTKGRSRRHREGALVYMGNSTFCVVERVMAQELTREQLRRLDGAPRLLLYVRTFGLKYNNKGRLRVATCGRRACCYALPDGTSCEPIFMSLRALWV